MIRSLLKKLTNQRLGALLLLTLLTATTAADAQTQSTINVCGTDYTLFTGFTATDGNGTNYAKLVDGNTSTDWTATKNHGDPNAPAGYFNGGTEDPAFVEFHADEAFIPKGYVLTCDHENAGFWKPVSWALKAKLNESDTWTTIHSSTTTLGAGKTFEIACDNDGDNQYQYFRFEVYEVGATMNVDLDELQFYGSLPAYTQLTVKAATCMKTGIKQDCYRRNSDGKYFTDETGTTEIAESDVIAPIIPHAGVHHDATDAHIEYWQCSMCSKYFSNEGCTTEITEEDTKIYRTITIDNSISGLVTVGFGETQALAGANVLLRVMDDRIDISTLKVNDGAVEVIPDGGDWYKFTMPAADVTVTAEVAQNNVDGEILTGSIKHRVTITDGASITLNNAIISGSIVCEGSATITLVGTNSVSGATNKAGIQIGGSGTTLTIRGEGSLTVNGGDQSAGIGLSSLMNYDSNVSSGDIVIEGGTITATGGEWGAGIGIGTVKNTNNDNSTSVQFGNITIKGGSVTAIGGDSGDGIGKGYAYSGPTITIGTVTIYDGINKVDASSIKDFASVVYKHVDGETETNVTASKTDYFAIGEDGNRRLIVQKPVIAEIAEQAYTGSAITPEPLVIAGSLSLTKGTDYTYSYENNTNAGTATVRATFQGKYASLGYVEKTFSICRNIYIADAIAHGKVSADSYLVDKDGIVTLTVTPDEGYSIGTVKYNDGTEDHTITPTDNGYTFTMPASDVTVSATFNPLSGNCGWSSVNNGEDVTWAVTDTDGNGTYETLTISGNGKIDSYSTDGQPWVAYKSEITTAVIKEGVTVIGYYLLKEFPALTNVSIASSVMTIGTSAFYGCSSLTTVNGASGVTYVSGRAFKGTAWENNLPDGLTYVGHVAYLFKGDATSVALDENTTQIAESAFYGSKITSIDIPASVTIIDDYAFKNSDVSTAVVHGDLSDVGNSAFSFSSLNTIVFHASIKIIETKAFEYSQLKRVYYLSTTLPTNVGNNAFYAHTQPSIVVPADADDNYLGVWHIFTGLRSEKIVRGYTITCGTGISATSSDNGPLVVKGETVTLSYGGTIPEGYTLKYVVKDASDNDVAVSESDGVYSFTMPESNVTVSAKWATTISVEVENADYMTAGDDANVMVTMTPDDFNGIATIGVKGDNDYDYKYKNVAIVNGEGRYVVNNLAGSYTVQASFAGDDNYTASTTAEPYSLYVPMITTCLDISLDKETINVGETATVSITLNKTGHTNAIGDPTLLETPERLQINDVVAVKVNSHGESIFVSLANGKGTYDLIGLEAGTYIIDVAYAGDDKYVSYETKKANKTLTLTVVKNPTTVGVEVDAPVIAKEQVLE